MTDTAFPLLETSTAAARARLRRPAAAARLHRCAGHAAPVDPVSLDDWNDLLAAAPQHTFFHTANWARVLAASYGYRPFYLRAGDRAALEGLLPVMEVTSPLTGARGVCLPFSDACEPLAAGADQFSALLSQALELGRERRWQYLEIRGGEQHLAPAPPSEEFVGHRLDLSCGPDRLFAELHGSTRRNIRRARQSGLEVTTDASPASLAAFCRLNDTTRRLHGLPPQPRRFFENFYEWVLARGMAFIVSASHEGRPVAANVYCCFGSNVLYKYGASDRRCQSLRPSDLVMWEAIRHCCDRGFRSLSFGRTEPGHAGLARFKEGWGARPYPIRYFRHDLRARAFVTRRPGISPAVTALLSRLPVPVLRALGAVLYRHMG